MNAPTSKGDPSARFRSTSGRGAVWLLAPAALLAGAVLAPLGAAELGPRAQTFASGAGSPSPNTIIAASLLALAVAAALLFVVWRRTKAERSRELSERDSRYRSLLEETNDALVAETGGLIVYANPAFLRLFQRYEGEVLGKSLHLLFAPESREKLLEVRTALIDADPVPESYEAIALAPGGGRFDVEIRAALVSFDGRETMQMTLRDVTRRKRAEVRLKRSEERYRSLFERNLAGVYRSDISGRLLDCNDALVRILGLASREEALQHPTTNYYFDPEDRSQLIARLLAEKALTNVEVRLRKKDGSSVWVLMNESLARADDGSLSVLEGSIVDVSARKRADEAIRESEERLRRLAAATFEGIVITEDGVILETNSQFAKLFGYEPEEIIGMSALDLVAPESQDLVSRHMQAGYEKPYEAMCRRKDGTLFPVEASGRAFPYEGRTVRVAAIRDITERQRVENELRQSEEKYRDLVEGSGALICLHDLEGRLVAINAAAARGLGHEQGSLLGRDIRDFLPATTHAAFAAYLEKVRKEGAAEGFMAVVTSQGETRIWHYNNSLRAEGTEGPLVRGMAIDVTDQRRAEKALRESEELYRVVTETATDAILTMDGNSTILFVNPATERIFGYSRAELIGQNLTMLMPERFRHLHEAGISRYNRTGEKRLTWAAVRFPGLDKSRREIPLELSFGEVVKDGRRLFTGIIRDISERALAEEENRNLQEQLAQSQKIEAVGQLAGGIAHDFNNLLTAIGGYSELLLGDLPPDDPRRAHAEEIRKAGERAASLTRQLLAFSRRQVLAPKVFDLNATVLDLERILGRLIGDHIQLRINPSAGLWTVKADPGQIGQAILNLAINARDAMPEGGTLTIETANVELGADYVPSHASVVPGPYAMVAITDTGTGMTEQVKAHIFEPFFTTKEQGKGTGLGLSTTYGIVKQSGGYIWCDSEPEHGATFKIYLPRVLEAVERDLPPAAPPAMLSGEETILLVEDEPEVRSLVQKVLKMQGYTVLAAANAEEALRVSGDFRGEIEMMVCDVSMPGLSGKQLAERLAESRPETKVLFMSGYTDDTIVHHGILDPGIAFLQKPFTPQALARKVREVLETAPEEFKIS